MGMVAEYMRARASDYGINPAYAYIVGLNHDIGYINGRENHGTFGADLLNSMGLYQTYADAIHFHGVSPYKVKDRALPVLTLRECTEVSWDEIHPDIRKNAYLTLLLEADMRVDAQGELVGFDRRITDISVRYKDPAVAGNAKSTVRYVFKWCEKNNIPKPPHIIQMRAMINQEVWLLEGLRKNTAAGIRPGGNTENGEIF